MASLGETKNGRDHFASMNDAVGGQSLHAEKTISGIFSHSGEMLN